MTKHSRRLARKGRACAETFPVIRSSGAQGHPYQTGKTWKVKVAVLICIFSLVTNNFDCFLYWETPHAGNQHSTCCFACSRRVRLCSVYRQLSNQRNVLDLSCQHRSIPVGILTTCITSCCSLPEGSKTSFTLPPILSPPGLLYFSCPAPCTRHRGTQEPWHCRYYQEGWAWTTVIDTVL